MKTVLTKPRLFPAKQNARRWLLLTAGGGLLVLTWALWTVCGRFPAVSSVFRRVAQLLSAVLGFLSGLLPVPAAEVLIAAIIILVLIRLIRILRQRDVRLLVDSLCQMIFGICAAVFLFVFLYGVHHTAPPLASQMGLEVGKYSVEQLEAFVAVCAEKANELAVQVPRDDKGDCDFGSFRAMAKQISDEYMHLANEYAVFDRVSAGRVKRSAVGGRIMSYVDLAGYYCPWVGESTVSSDVVDTHIPFDIAHEQAHSMGIGPEAECNFAAWLVCKDSEDVRFRYSGWLLAYIYSGNALFSADQAAWAQQYEILNEQVRHDLQVLNDSLARFEGTKANELGSKANDALIKATGQPEGIRSYGKVVDLMLAYFSVENE